MSEKLLPCPFCGEEAEIESFPVFTNLRPYSPETADKKYYVQCKGCATQCGALEYDTPEEAMAAWNRRTGGWIAVTEKLPEDDPDISRYSDSHFEFCTVMAAGFYAGSNRLSVGQVNRLINYRTGIEYIDRVAKTLDEWYWGGSFEKVTHWMPMPQGPEGAERKNG